MVTYKAAKKGYKWALTGTGFELGRVRNKFEKDYPQRTLYEKKVPVSWFEKGWVVEMKEG
jgi:hypothetical protein